jgi:hypothetical protein
MVKPHLAAAIICISVGAACTAAPAGFSLQHSEKSPRGDMFIQEFWRDNPDQTHTVQIWLTSASDPHESALLFEHQRAASVVMSPDESRVAVNHHASSTDALVLVFQRVAGVHYKELVGTDIVREKALSSLSRSTGHKADLELDHLYADCVLWAADSSAFLVRLTGHTGNAALDDWFCIFRLSDQTISLDLADLDRHSFTENAR